MRRLLLVLLVTAASASMLSAQEAKFDVVAALRRGAVTGECHDAKLPFDYAGSMLRIAAKVGARDCLMLLDSGAPMAVTPSVAKDLDLQPIGSLPTRDANNNLEELKFVVLPACEVGGVVYSDLVAAVIDLQSTSILRARGIDGLIGGNLLRLGALAIDYPNRTIELAATAAPLHPAGVSLSFEPDVQGSPHLQLRFGTRTPTDVMLDTGYNDFARLPLAALGEPLPQRLSIDGFTGMSAFGKDGEGSWLCWMPAVELGGVALPGTVLSAQSGKSLLGNRFFERMRIVLDWQQHQLWVEHPDQLGRQELRTHGLAIYPERDGVWVANVVEGSPAAVARLKPGERVLAIDDIDLRSGGADAFVQAFVRVRQEPDKLLVTVERDGKPVAIELQPERLLPH